MSFGPWELPAGVHIAPSIYLMHRRADLFPQPLAFRPERFLGDDPPGTYEWIPFGGGVRRCLGASFAMFEMRVVLAAVLGQRPAAPGLAAHVRVGHPPRDHVRAVARGADRESAREPPHRIRVTPGFRATGRSGAMNLMGMVESTFSRVNSTVFRQVNRATDWWNLPLPVALLNLRAHRDDLRRHNLYDTEAPRENGAATDEELPAYRTYDGSRQDPLDPRMGMVGSRFGRNAPPTRPLPSRCPSAWSRTRARSPTGCCCGASSSRRRASTCSPACWIQFQNHDWFGHGENAPDTYIDIELDENDEWPEGTPMRPARDEPRPHPHRNQRPAADLRQHRHALVGPLPALRLDRGAQPRAALGRGRQARARGRHAPQRDRPEARRGRPDRLRRQLLGRPLAPAHAVRQGAQLDLRPPQGLAIRPGTTSGCSSPRAWSTRR